MVPPYYEDDAEEKQGGSCSRHQREITAARADVCHAAPSTTGTTTTNRRSSSYSGYVLFSLDVQRAVYEELLPKGANVSFVVLRQNILLFCSRWHRYFFV